MAVRSLREVYFKSWTQKQRLVTPSLEMMGTERKSSEADQVSSFLELSSSAFSSKGDKSEKKKRIRLQVRQTGREKLN